MTKADLVEHVTDAIAQTSGPMISKKDCARVVDSFLDAIKDALKEQKNIEVFKFHHSIFLVPLFMIYSLSLQP